MIKRTRKRTKRARKQSRRLYGGAMKAVSTISGAAAVQKVSQAASSVKNATMSAVTKARAARDATMSALTKAKEARNAVTQKAKNGYQAITSMFTTKEKTGNEEPECSYLDMVKYGALSILLSPLYVATVIANLPMNTINNLSDNRLKKVEIDALSKQLYKYLFYGYKNGKELDYTQFKLPDETNIIQDKKIVVGCNTCKKTQLEFRAEQFGQKGQTGGQFQKGGQKEIQFQPVRQNGGKVDFLKMILNSMGVLGGKTKLEFNLTDTLDYVENMPKLNLARKEDLERSLQHITDIKMLARLLILMNTLFDKNMCENAINLDPNTKTVIDSVHVSRIMNPFALMEAYSQKENKFKIDYKETSRCIIKHIMSDTFTGDECRNKCKTCTFQTNLVTLMGNYVRLLSNVFRGTDRGMITIIQLFFSMLTSYKMKKDPVEKHDLYKVLAESYITKEKEEFYKELYEIRYDVPVEEFIQENRENYEVFKKIFCDYGLTYAIQEHIRTIVEKNLLETNKLKQGSESYYKTKIRSFFKSNFYFIPA
jgi:hypothetical protein